MKKRKVNPNRVPVNAASINTHAITEKASREVMFRVWLDFLAALAGFADTTGQTMLDLWDNVNTHATAVHKFHDVEHVLRDIENITGVHLAFKKITVGSCNTQGGLKRLESQARKNAVASAFALIAGPILYGDFFDKEMTARLLSKALSYEEDISSGRLRLADIQMMLLDEYSVELEQSGTGSSLAVYKCEKKEPPACTM